MAQVTVDVNGCTLAVTYEWERGDPAAGLSEGVSITGINLTGGSMTDLLDNDSGEDAWAAILEACYQDAEPREE